MSRRAPRPDGPPAADRPGRCHGRSGDVPAVRREGGRGDRFLGVTEHRPGLRGIRLAHEGASVVINGRRLPQLQTTERELLDQGLAVAAVPGSLLDETTTLLLVNTAVERFGGIDLVVNTIGGDPAHVVVAELTRQQLLETMRLNTWPAVALVQRRCDAASPTAVARSSTSRAAPPQGDHLAWSPTPSAKAALNAMTRTMAADLGRQGGAGQRGVPRADPDDGHPADVEGRRRRGRRAPAGRSDG